MSQIEIGDRVKDVVTGFTGVVVGITKWMTGCDTVAVNPAEIKDGKPVENSYFDVNRLEIIKKQAVRMPKAAAATKPGGPQYGY